MPVCSKYAIRLIISCAFWGSILANNIRAETPTYSGKPCLDRPGSPYPHEGSGLCTGNLQIPISVATTPMELIYNSQSTRNLGYGVGWSLNIDQQFEIAGGTATLYLGDSTPIAFLSAGGTWTASYAVLYPDAISTVNASTLRKSRFDGVTETFSSVAGSSTRFANTQETSRRGIEATLTRNTAGQITSYRNRFNESWTLSYSSGRLTSIRDLAGGMYSLTYDASGNLIRVAYPDGLSVSMTYHTGTSLLKSFSNRKNQTTNYTYFTAAGTLGALATSTDYEGNITSVSYSPSSVSLKSFHTDVNDTISISGGLTVTTSVKNGLTETNTYDSLLRLIRSVDHFSGLTTYNYNGLTPYVTSLTASDGTVITYTLNSNNLPVTITETYGTTSKQTLITRNSYGDVLNVKENAATNLLTTTLQYDAKGNITSVNELSGRTAFSGTYDVNSVLTSTVSVEGYTSSFTNDSKGRVINASYPTAETQSYSYDLKGNVTYASSSQNRSANFTYDAVDRLSTNSQNIGTSTKQNQVVYGASGEQTITSNNSVNSSVTGGKEVTLDHKQRNTSTIRKAYVY